MIISSHLDLCANPLISGKVYDQLPNEVKRLIFDYMLTPATSVKNLQSQIEWLTQMEFIEKAFEAPDGLPEGKFGIGSNLFPKIECRVTYFVMVHLFFSRWIEAVHTKESTKWYSVWNNRWVRCYLCIHLSHLSKYWTLFKICQRKSTEQMGSVKWNIQRQNVPRIWTGIHDVL